LEIVLEILCDTRWTECISEKASSVGNTISLKTTELDDKFKISEKVSAMNEAVSNATKKAMENETVAKGIGAFKVSRCETSHGRIRKHIRQKNTRNFTVMLRVTPLLWM
jgi:hypothetical protein